MLQIAGNLREQHRIGTGGNAGLQRNPTRLLPATSTTAIFRADRAAW